MTTSAAASSARPRTVSRPGSPGPPPTSATEPAATSAEPSRVVLVRRTGSRPDSRAARTASRTATARPGSPSAVTATATPSAALPGWPAATAGRQAGDPARDPALPHQTRAARTRPRLRRRPPGPRSPSAPARPVRGADVAGGIPRSCQGDGPAVVADEVLAQPRADDVDPGAGRDEVPGARRPDLRPRRAPADR